MLYKKSLVVLLLIVSFIQFHGIHAKQQKNLFFYSGIFEKVQKIILPVVLTGVGKCGLEVINYCQSHEGTIPAAMSNDHWFYVWCAVSFPVVVCKGLKGVFPAGIFTVLFTCIDYMPLRFITRVGDPYNYLDPLLEKYGIIKRA